MILLVTGKQNSALDCAHTSNTHTYVTCFHLVTKVLGHEAQTCTVAIGAFKDAPPYVSHTHTHLDGMDD